MVACSNQARGANLFNDLAETAPLELNSWGIFWGISDSRQIARKWRFSAVFRTQTPLGDSDRNQSNGLLDRHAVPSQINKT
jgi:hypothetical protein